jgi:hypothetical protein
MRKQSKKEREREIVDLVYAFRQPFKIDDGEQPDFIARLAPMDKPFGIEVTEFFHSESEARLDRVPGYVGDLLKGGVFRHKTDRQELIVDKIKIMSGGAVKFSGVPAIVQEAPPIAECAAMVAKIIRNKSEKLNGASRKLRHINLIIRDCTGLLGHRKPSDFYSLYCTDALTTAVFGSPFREVYFVTRLSVGDSFIPLKMVVTLAQLYFFRAALRDPALDALTPDCDFIEYFGSYLDSIAGGGVLVRGDAPECEAIYGDTGFLLDPRLKLQLRMYSDVPVEQYGPVNPSVGFTLHPTISQQVRAFQREHTFSSGIAFRVRSGEHAGV